MATNVSSSRTSRAMALAISQGTNMLLGIALSAGLSWNVEDKAVYGSFQQILLIFSVLAGPLSIGLPNAVFYFLPRLSMEVRKGFLIAAHLTLFVTGALISAFLFFGADLIGGWMGSEHLPSMLRVFFPLPLFLMPAMILDSTMMTHHRVWPLVMIQVGTRLATVLGVLIPTLTGLGINAGLFLWVLLAALTEVIAIIVIFQPYRHIRTAWEEGLGTKITRFVAPIAAVTLLQPLVFASDKLIVSAVYGAAAYAIYSNGVYAVTSSMTIITKAISVLIVDFNTLFKDDRFDEACVMWRRVTFKLSLVIFAIVGFVVPGAPDIVGVLFSQRYAGSAIVMSITVIAVIPRCLVIGSVLQAMGKSGWYSSITLLAAVINPLMIFGLGVMAGASAVWAAVGYVVGEYIHHAYQILLVKKVIHVSPLRVLPVRELLALLAFSVGLGFASSMIAGLLFADSTFPLPKLILSGAIFVVGYIYGSMALRIATWQNVWQPLFAMARIPASLVPSMLRK